MKIFLNKNLKLLIFYLIILIFAHTVNATEITYHLTTEQWAIPRSVNSILTIDAISFAMESMRLDSNSTLIIHYPGGDEGSLWATELRSWLISLGLSTSRINLIPGSSDIKQIDLEIRVDSKFSVEAE